MTRLEIINSTLIKAGQTPVDTVDESKASRIINRQLKGSLDYVGCAHPWDELKKNTIVNAFAKVEEPVAIHVDGVIYTETSDGVYTDGTTVITVVPEYTIPGTLDLSTLADAAETFALAPLATQQEGTFSIDGLHFYAIDSASDTLVHWDLLAPFDFTGAVARATDVTNPPDGGYGVELSSDGYHLYLLANATQDIIHWTLSTQWDTSTLSKSGTPTSITPAPVEITISLYGVRISDDGTKMYVLESGSAPPAIYQYDLSTPFEPSSYTYASKSLVLAFSDQSAFCFSFSICADGRRLYVFDVSTKKLWQYDLGIPWDISSATNPIFSTFASIAGSLVGGYIPREGGGVYIIDDTTNVVQIWGMAGTALEVEEVVFIDGIATASATYDYITSGSDTFQAPAPNDFIRLVEEDPKGYKYDRIHRAFTTEDESFAYSYVFLPTDVVLTGYWQDLPYDDAAFDNLNVTEKFVDVLGYHILSRCSYSITGDHNDTQIFANLYKDSLGKIGNVQAQQRRDLFLQANELTSWEGSRI